MNIVILNGSPRKGNTLTAIQALAESAGAVNQVEIVDTYDLQVAPCKGCNACQCYKGCIDQDDSNAIVDKIVAADLVVFATPVYWWGMTAQLKMVLDKCYCKGAMLKGKKIGLIVVGGADTSHRQYTLIEEQFRCIEASLKWDILFFRKYSATAKDDLAKETEMMAELREIGAELA